jgi:hypothetical protein
MRQVSKYSRGTTAVAGATARGITVPPVRDVASLATLFGSDLLKKLDKGVLAVGPFDEAQKKHLRSRKGLGKASDARLRQIYDGGVAANKGYIAALRGAVSAAGFNPENVDLSDPKNVGALEAVTRAKFKQEGAEGEPHPELMQQSSQLAQFDSEDPKFKELIKQYGVAVPEEKAPPKPKFKSDHPAPVQLAGG